MWWVHIVENIHLTSLYSSLLPSPCSVSDGVRVVNLDLILSRCHWLLLIHFRTAQDLCRACLERWARARPPATSVTLVKFMSHIVITFEGGMQHRADEAGIECDDTRQLAKIQCSNCSGIGGLTPHFLSWPSHFSIWTSSDPHFSIWTSSDPHFSIWTSSDPHFSNLHMNIIWPPLLHMNIIWPPLLQSPYEHHLTPTFKHPNHTNF